MIVPEAGLSILDLQRYRWPQGSLDFHGLKVQPTPRRRNLLGGLYPIFTTCTWGKMKRIFFGHNFQ